MKRRDFLKGAVASLGVVAAPAIALEAKEAVTPVIETLPPSTLATQVPVSFIFDTATAKELSRNEQVVEVVRLILPQLGYPVD